MNKLIQYILEQSLSGNIQEGTAKSIIKSIQQSAKKSKDIGVVGVALKFPSANSPDQFWRNILDKRDCIGKPSAFRKNEMDKYCRHMGYGDNKYAEMAYIDGIEQFDYSFFGISPKEAQLMDPNQRMFLETAWKAFEDAGVSAERLKGSKTGIYLGFRGESKYRNLIREFEPEFLSMSYAGNLEPIIASRISHLLDLRGPSLLIDTACSSSLLAVHLACQGIRNGDCEMAVAGSAKINLFPVLSEQNLGIESADNRTRTFDSLASGIGHGEGIAAVILKPLSRAIEDRNNIYAVIKGSAINHDGTAVGLTAPNPAAQAEVITQAWKDAGIDPETIRYIEAHGTATRLGDPIEIDGIQRAFRKYTGKQQFCAIGSIKSGIGHLDSAAGIASFIKAALSLKHRVLPPTMHFERPNPSIDFEQSPLYVNDKESVWESDVIRRCGVSAFGLSGTNCHIVLEEAPRPIGETKERATASIFTLSAKSVSALRSYIIEYIRDLDESASIQDICYTASVCRTHYAYRVAICARNIGELKSKLSELLIQGLESQTSLSDKGIYYSGFTNRRTDRVLEVQDSDHDVLEDICFAYVEGAPIEWERYYADEQARLTTLPTYPFDRSLCWIDQKTARPSDMHIVRWIKSDGADRKRTGKRILILNKWNKSGVTFLNKLIEEGHRVYERGFDEDFLCDDTFCLDNQMDELSTIINNHEIDTIVIFSLSGEKWTNDWPITHWLKLTQALLNHHAGRELDVVLIADYVNAITGTEKSLNESNAMLAAFAKVANIESAFHRYRYIDIDSETPAESAVAEISLTDLDLLYGVGYRNGQRYTEVISSVDRNGGNGQPAPVREGGTYLISGGMGRIGMHIAKYLASTKRVYIVLLQRSSVPSADIESQIRTIEAAGSRIKIVAADASDKNGLRAAYEEAVASFGKINGLFHCAGIGIGRQGISIRDMTAETLKTTLAPKVQGLFEIDQLTKNEKMDFVMLFSSAITITSGYGGCDYVAANAFMDAYVYRMRNRGQKAVTVNWPTWVESESEWRDEKQVFTPVTVEEGIQYISRILAADLPRVIPGAINYFSPVFELHKQLPFRLEDESKIRSLKPVKPTIVSNASMAEVQLIGKEEGEAYTETERLLGNVFGHVLGLDLVHLDHGFYSLGGDSIIAMKIIHMTNHLLEVSLEVTDLLKYPTLREYAERVGRITANIAADSSVQPHMIPPADKNEYYPVSSGQKRIYILNQLEKSSVAYNLFGVCLLEGELDLPRLDQVFRKLITRHESLRTWFELADGIPVQRIAENFNFSVECKEYIGEQDEGSSEVESLVRSMVRPFDLSQAPLFRAGIIPLSKKKHLLVTDMHHIISDGVSIDILVREFVRLYEGANLPLLSVQYKDYTHWQNGRFKNGEYASNEKYWLGRFAGEIPVLNLPTVYPRPAVQQFEGDTFRFSADAELAKRLKAVGNENGATLYMVILAAYCALLHKYTGQEDIVVGSPIAGRPHSDLENIIGMFVNTLALRNYPGAAKTFRQLLLEVKDNAIEAYKHQDYPFEELVAKLNLTRDMSRNPLFDTMLISLDIDPSMRQGEGLSGLKVRPMTVSKHTSKFDITVSFRDRAHEITFEVEYSTRLFDKDYIKHLSQHFLAILKEVTADPDKALSSIDMLMPEERHRLINEFNPPAIDAFAPIKLFRERFEEQAAEQPSRIAIVCGDQQLTYEQLNQRANRLSHYLRRLGIGSGDIIAIMTRRSVSTVTAILGVIKSGAAFLPIDPDYPSERIAYMLKDSGAKCILSYGVDWHDDSIVTVDLSDSERFALESDINPEEHKNGGHPAYLLYTSGSTGLPKGVLISERSLASFIEAILQRVDFHPHKCMLALTSVSFDIFTVELLVPLTIGMKVVMAEERQQKDLPELCKLIKEENVDMMQATPSRMQLFFTSKVYENVVSQFKDILIGGEKFPERLFTKLRSSSLAKIHNLYGPTEATVWSTVKTVEDEASVTIGLPLSNTQIYILDQQHNPVPIGVQGEIFIGGTGVAIEYLNRPELTAERFLSDQFRPGERMYKTGDVGSWLPNGEIAYGGRSDQQLKISGHRIEPAEIERTIIEFYPEIRDCAVVAWDHAGGARLAAYLQTEQLPNPTEIRTRLQRVLPSYLIPAAFVALVAFPTTPNGKTDRKRFPDPFNNADPSMPDPGKALGSGHSVLERKLIKLWEEILNKNNIDIHDNFFELGGTSLLLIQLHSILEQEYPGRIEVVNFFSNPTIAQLARYIAKDDGTEEESPSARLPVFPDRFFSSGSLGSKGKRETVSLNLEVDKATKEALSEMAVQEQIGLPEILYALYGYLLSDLCESDNVFLHYYDRGSRDCNLLSIQFKELESLSDLFKLVKNQMSQPVRARSITTSVRKLDKQVASLVTDASEIPFEVKDSYDLLIWIKSVKSSIRIVIEFNKIRLEPEEMKYLAFLYMELLRSVTNSNGNQEEIG